MPTVSTKSLSENLRLTDPVELQYVPKGHDLKQEIIPPGCGQGLKDPRWS